MIRLTRSVAPTPPALGPFGRSLKLVAERNGQERVDGGKSGRVSPGAKKSSGLQPTGLSEY